MDETVMIEIESQLDKVVDALKDGKPVSMAYDNGCATFIIEVSPGKNEQQREICGNDLVYALAYVMGIDDFFSA